MNPHETFKVLNDNLLGVQFGRCKVAIVVMENARPVIKFDVHLNTGGAHCSMAIMDNGLPCRESAIKISSHCSVTEFNDFLEEITNFRNHVAGVLTANGEVQP